jgi:DNA modification methylase
MQYTNVEKGKMSETKTKVTPAKGRPMLHWVGKKPLEYVKGFPAQLSEVFDPQNTAKVLKLPSYENLKENWHNLLFHGDNKDVLATLLELGFREKIDLIYIDPPFSSNKDYVRKVELRGLKELGRLEEDDVSIIQQVMYEDMWKRDEYFQFMYERLMLMKELLSRKGSIYVHLDYRVVHYIKLLMDEIFGYENLRNEIVWCYTGPSSPGQKQFSRKHDNILFYTKSQDANVYLDNVRIPYKRTRGVGNYKGETWGEYKVDFKKGKIPEDWWYLPIARFLHKEDTGFQTQKPEALLERIINACSREGDLVLDCFMGSGTTAAVAQKLHRRWIGVDINKGAIQLTSNRLQRTILEQIKEGKTRCPSFAIYKVNDYDLKLLRTEAIELAVQHIGIKRTRTDPFFDGHLGKNLVKIIDFNHPLTLLDLQLTKDEIKKRPNEDRDITVVCLGKELAVDPWIDEWNKKHPVNRINVIELKTDKKYGGFLIHKPDEARVKIERIDRTKALVEIQDFISPTIIQRLNIEDKLFKVKIPDFRSMIETVLIDKNYDGKVFHTVYSDVPKRNDDLIHGEYEIEIPASKTRVAVKIIDMLGEEVLITEEI